MGDIATYYDRYKYPKLHRLSQDHIFKIEDYDRRLEHLPKETIPGENRLSVEAMYRALDRQELLYLPSNHTIASLEYQEFSQKYQIHSYGGLDKQVRFCVTVMSRNNMENNRYTKVMDSILQQEYENYHIVFIDDVSTDGTLASTAKYLESLNFPRDRV